MMARATRASSRALGHPRMLDLGIIMAGAATSRISGDPGADVIKIEATSRPVAPRPGEESREILTDSLGYPDLDVPVNQKAVA
jgi:crotonobetainyl-CoA:carnitine CoA-transferase CaiB-like acyl-CoA transferase